MYSCSRGRVEVSFLSWEPSGMPGGELGIVSDLGCSSKYSNEWVIILWDLTKVMGLWGLKRRRFPCHQRMCKG